MKNMSYLSIRGVHIFFIFFILFFFNVLPVSLCFLKVNYKCFSNNISATHNVYYKSFTVSIQLDDQV